MGKASIDDFVALIHDPAFGVLSRRLATDLFSYDEFRTLPMPEGRDPLEMWRLFTALRRQTARVFPLHDWVMPGEGLRDWCSIGSSVEARAASVMEACRGWRSAATESRSGLARHHSLQRLSGDLSAALARDGVPISAGTVLELAAGSREPGSADELIARNALGMLADCPKIARKPLTQWILDDIELMLADGIAKRDLPAVERTYPLPLEMPTDEDLVRVLLGMLNGLDPYDATAYLLDQFAFSIAAWQLRPFGCLSGVFELVLRRTCNIRFRMELLNEVPFSALCAQWAEGTLDPAFSVVGGMDDMQPDVGEGADVTFFMANCLRIVDHAIRRALDGDRPTASGSPKGARGRTAHLLAELAERPGGSVTIAQYQALYGVSRSTARTDLLALADEGKLDLRYAGRVQVFTLPRG